MCALARHMCFVNFDDILEVFKQKNHRIELHLNLHTIVSINTVNCLFIVRYPLYT